MSKTRLILTLSILLNFVAVIVASLAITKAGGLAVLTAGILARKKLPGATDPYYDARVRLLAALPLRSSQVVMLGDSITRNGEWQEFVPGIDVVNRGVGNDTTDGVLKRLPGYLAGKPAKLFLLIGTNDLQRGAEVAAVERGCERIISVIQRLSPGTKVYLQTLLPCSHRSIDRNRILEANAMLRETAARTGVTLIDLYRYFVDESGRPIPDYFIADRLHLAAKGYARWVEVLSPYLSTPSDADSHWSSNLKSHPSAAQ